MTENLYTVEFYDRLPNFFENYINEPEKERNYVADALKEIFSEVEVESAESQTVLKPLIPKIEKTSEKKATSKSKEVATPTITKVKAKDKTATEVEHERITDLESGPLPDANSYQVNISGVPANLPDGYVQKILTFDEMREASKMYRNFRELKMSISRSIASLEITHAIKSYEKLRETHSVARSTKELFELLKVNLVAKDCRAISAELNAATVSFARRQLSEKL